MPVILIIGAIIIAVGFGTLMFFSPTANDETQTPEDSSNEINVRVEEIEDMNDVDITDQSQDPTPTSDKKTLEASSTYLTPARTEHLVDVSLTIKDGVVTDSTVRFDNKPEGESSNDNQARFDKVYKTEVIGKSLSEISLSRVGGASLTSKAFNEAVAKISEQTSNQS